MKQRCLLSIVIGLLLAGIFSFVIKARQFKTTNGNGIVFVAYRGGDSFISQLFARGDIYAIDQNGTGAEVPAPLTKTGLRSRYGFPDELEWSPDGKWIAFSTRYENARAGGDSEVYIMRSDGSSEPVRVTNTPYSDQSPTWAPDGTRIAYVHGGIRILDIECILRGEECETTSTFLAEGLEPNWSPDGKMIVYVAWPENRGSIFVIRVDGTSKSAKISSGDQYCHRPQWSPNGEKIAFDCGGSIYIAAPDGSNLVRLVEDADTPRWSPDGSQIAFIGGKLHDPNLGKPVGLAGFDSPPPSSNALFVVNVDGTNVRRLTQNNYQVITQFRWWPPALQ